ncbi:MAG: class I SAM-dependent methyltransferase [Bacteroidota bacterium]
MLRDEELDLVLTYPQPEAEKLGAYYESEDYISHTDGNRSWFEKTYQLVKNLAIKRKISIINQTQKEKGLLLDIGAGTGDFLVKAKEHGWQIIGVEPSTKARRLALQKDVPLIEDTEILEDNSVDVITMWHVLEHIPDVEKQIRELKRLLKPTGTVIIAVPNFNSYDADYYGIYWAAYDVPRHLWHFSRQSIHKLFGREKLQVRKERPLLFDAFYVAMLSEKYKSGSMNLFNAFLIGLKSNWSARKNREYSSVIYEIKNFR